MLDRIGFIANSISALIDPTSYFSTFSKSTGTIMVVTAAGGQILMRGVNCERQKYQFYNAIFQKRMKDSGNLLVIAHATPFNNKFLLKSADTKIDEKTIAWTKAFFLTSAFSASVDCLIEFGIIDRSSPIAYLPGAAYVLTTCGVVYSTHQSVMHGDNSNRT